MSISSDEVNFLVYRYLQESGKCENTTTPYSSLSILSDLHYVCFYTWP